jgi:lipopolysaccharide export system protein LptA
MTSYRANTVLLFLFLFAFRVYFAQDSSKVIITGDSFVGEKINGEEIRKFIGNVVITQNNVHIVCDTAVQYLTQNKVELIGNVIITQDTIIVKTKRGFYYGNEKEAFSNEGITLNNGHALLKADAGFYLTETKVARFFNNVSLKDSTRLLTCGQLINFTESDSTVATENVALQDTASTIFADTIKFVRRKNFTDAKGRVKVASPKQSLFIFSERLLNYSDSNYTLLSGRPLLVKLDSTFSSQKDSLIRIDTLFLSANIMESYSDSVSLLKAIDSVLIYRGDFASRNDVTYFFRNENKIFTFKKSEEAKPPILWNGKNQLSGDSIFIFIKNKSLRKINVYGNAVVISQNEGYDYRFDQLSGDTLSMFFDKGKLTQTYVTGNVLSIYYLYDKGEANGLIKSSGKAAKIYFENGKVSKVKLFGSPESEYHPEKLIEGKEQDFTLPTFILYKNRPTKKETIGKWFKSLNLDYNGR